MQIKIKNRIVDMKHNKFMKSRIFYGIVAFTVLTCLGCSSKYSKENYMVTFILNDSLYEENTRFSPEAQLPVIHTPTMLPILFILENI
jgi:hypothetical protein